VQQFIKANTQNGAMALSAANSGPNKIALNQSEQIKALKQKKGKKGKKAIKIEGCNDEQPGESAKDDISSRIKRGYAGDQSDRKSNTSHTNSILNMQHDQSFLHTSIRTKNCQDTTSVFQIDDDQSQDHQMNRFEAEDTKSMNDDD
jgi:hypothetical protein